MRDAGAQAPEAQGGGPGEAGSGTGGPEGDATQPSWFAAKIEGVEFTGQPAADQPDEGGDDPVGQAGPGAEAAVTAGEPPPAALVEAWDNRVDTLHAIQALERSQALGDLRAAYDDLVEGTVGPGQGAQPGSTKPDGSPAPEPIVQEATITLRPGAPNLFPFFDEAAVAGVDGLEHYQGM